MFVPPKNILKRFRNPTKSLLTTLPSVASKNLTFPKYSFGSLLIVIDVYQE